EVFWTLLPASCDAAHCPEIVVFQEPGDRQTCQARYVLRPPFKDARNSTCPAAEAYRRDLGKRQEAEAQNLATLTGWRIDDIRKEIGVSAPDEKKWWQKLWNGD